jgi:hypothetical protein
MASLQVLSAPQNQPTLNPRVVTNPVQPTLDSRVVSNPVQPTLAPRVAQPIQPQFNPQVQSLPAQPQINVDNSPRFIPLGEVVKAKFPGIYDSIESGALGKIIVAKYPGVYDHLIEPAVQANEEPQGESGIKGFGLGAVKGALNTVKNTSGVINKIGSYVPNTIKQAFGLTPVGLASRATAKVGNKLSQYDFSPQGTAEKIGFGTEQAAEFLIPGGAVGKAGKAADLAIEGLNVGSKATKALQLAGKVGFGAGEAAGITALQGGDKSDVKTAAVLGGAFSVVAKGIESILKKVPQTAWSSILKRTPLDAAKNPNLPQQATETGLVGLSRQGIANKAQEAIQSIEVTLDDLLSKSNVKINPAKVAGYLSDLRQSYAVIPGEQSSVSVIDRIIEDLYAGFKEGKSLSAVEANQLKRDIYSVIAKSYGKGTFEIPAKVEAQKTIARGLKSEIEKVIPEAKTLNERQAVYIQIKKALDKTIARTEGKGIAGTGVGLHDLLIAGVGTGAGALTGNPFLGLGLVALKKTGESTAVMSASAKLLNYFNTLSPTKKLLFYQAIKGLTVKTGSSLSGTAAPQAK